MATEIDFRRHLRGQLFSNTTAPNLVKNESIS